MRHNKSTNVRIQKHITNRPMSLFIRTLNALSTELAASFAEYLFFRAPKRRLSGEQERSIFARGESFELPFGGEVLRAWRFGHSGPRVLLAHGWGGSAAQLAGFVEPLLERGYSVLAFDAPGHGLSTGNASSIRDFAAAIRAVSGGPLHGIIAHSMGSGTAMLAAALGLRVDRAVFIAPPSDPTVWFDKFSAYLSLPEELEARSRARLEKYLGARFEDMNAEHLGPGFGAPLLVIHDRNDKEVPWRDGEAVVDSVPSGAMITTEGLGHNRILNDPSVIERSVAFIAGEIQRTEHTCKSCGTTAPLKQEFCQECTLSRELFDRTQRWAQLAVTS